MSHRYHDIPHYISVRCNKLGRRGQVIKMDDASIKPIHPLFGAEVFNFYLKSLISPDSNNSTVQFSRNISDLKQLVHKYKVVVFKKQGILTPEEQVEVSSWFGEVEEAGFEQHPKSPLRQLLRVSNDDTEGFRDFGTSGFHVDGSFMEKPNDFSIYHIVKTPQRATTAFVDLGAVYNGLCSDDKLWWKRLWMVKTYKRIRGHTEHPGYVIHPLVYSHPITGLQTLCIHQGKTSRYLQDWGVNIAEMKSKEATSVILADIERALNTEGGKYQYYHKWKTGDLIISDNLAVAHRAEADTQLPRAEVGLRIMHRTVITGTHRPWSDAKSCLHEYTKGKNADNIDMDDVDDEDADVIKNYSFGDMEKMHKLSRALNK